MERTFSRIRSELLQCSGLGDLAVKPPFGEDLFSQSAGTDLGRSLFLRPLRVLKQRNSPNQNDINE